MATNNTPGYIAGLMRQSVDDERQYFKNHPSTVTQNDTPQQAQSKRDAEFSQMVTDSIGHDNPGQYWPINVPKVTVNDTPEQAAAKKQQAFQQMMQNSIAHEQQQMQQQRATMQPAGQVPLAALGTGLGFNGL